MQRHERVRRTEPPAEAPQPPAPRAETILGLQRSAGNRAVAQMLSRNGPEPKAKTPADEFNDAVKAGSWDAASLVLDRSNTEIQALLKPLSKTDPGKLDAGGGQPAQGDPAAERPGAPQRRLPPQPRAGEAGEEVVANALSDDLGRFSLHARRARP
jgi:hypothetical protein